MSPFPARALCLLAATAAAAAPAQMAPWARWQTLTTAHYRIHYPPPLEAWAREVAGRIEAIHDRVTAQVGYRYPGPIQVLLEDPVAEPNGLAVPLVTVPHVVLWRTGPDSDSPLGTYPANWTEVLLAHELTHIHHLTRPARPGSEATGSLFRLPLGPLALRTPRWVSEGYATLLEGRVTGSGRPHSSLRAAVLRQWARNGKLPAYEDINGDRGYLGGAMAYLVGSAYLEWLERKRPDQPDLLQRLWRQLASGRHRTFAEAFTATLGFDPRDGYQRFQAEASHDALEWEARLRAQGLREGTLWARVDGGVSGLGVSPDGRRLLARLETRRHPGLAVWDLAGPDRNAGARTPAEPADAPPEFPPPVLLARLPALDHQLPREPRWLDDHTVLFQLPRPDREGTLRPAPARWLPATGAVTLAGPAAAPPGRILVPTRNRDRWVLEWDGQVLPLPGPAAGRAWVDERRRVVYAACDLDGIWNLVRLPYQGDGPGRRFGPPEPLTRTPSAAWNPAPTPDGRWLFYTRLDARGMEIRKLDLGLPPLAPAPPGPGPEARILAPDTVLEARPGPGLPDQPAPVPAPSPYRAAANLWNHPVAALSLTPSGRSVQLGLAGADFLGRLSWQALAGLGDGAGPRGATLGLASAAWAWKPSLALFSALERPSRQSFAPVAADRERRGAELALAWDDLGPVRFWASPALAWERVAPLDGAQYQRGLAALGVGVRLLRARGPWGLDLAPVLQAGQGFSTAPGGRAWQVWRGSLRLRLETPFLPVTLTGEQGALHGHPTETFTLGGVTTSLVPTRLDLGRVEQPALPARTAVGDRLLRWRGELGGPLRFYVEGVALWAAGQERSPFQRVLGLEGALDPPARYESERVRRPVQVRLGLHRPLDGAMAGRTVATVTVALRP